MEQYSIEGAIDYTYNGETDYDTHLLTADIHTAMIGVEPTILPYDIPCELFDDIRLLCGEYISDDIITQSISEACDFFHIETPYVLFGGDTIGVALNDPLSFQDDILIFSGNKLSDMGISGKDGVDLIMTHECGHRILQDMDNLLFDSHQEELCCDFMAGVRAGLNNTDISQIENFLEETTESYSHPSGVDRIGYMYSGIEFAQQYYDEHNIAPTFDECLDHFCELNEIEQEYENNRMFDTKIESIDDTNSQIETDDAYNVSFQHQPTKAEIEREKADALKKQKEYEGKAKHHIYMAEHPLDGANGVYHAKEAAKYERLAEQCKAEYIKWKNMKPKPEK